MKRGGEFLRKLAGGLPFLRTAFCMAPVLVVFPLSVQGGGILLADICEAAPAG